MNSEKSSPIEYYEASSVAHSFSIKWRIPVHLFFSGPHTPRTMPQSFIPEPHRYLEIMQPSKLIKFENMPPFVLVLLRHPRDWTFHLDLVCEASNAGVKLEYAFASIGESVFFLGLTNKYPPDYIKDLELTSRKIMNLGVDYVTIVCGISASSDVCHQPSNDTDSGELIYECSLRRGDEEPPEATPDLRSGWSTSTSSSGAEAFAKYSLSGALPSLDVDLAKELLVVSKECAELKALCLKFLIGHLDPGNVVGVLKVACESREEQLLSECYDFMSEKCRVVHK